MEEVDSIILSALRDIGCSVEEDVSSLLSFSPQLLVEACVRCLRIIVPNYEGSHVMPEAMSAKYRVCTDLANSIKDAGYPGEIGYQTFLYSSVKEWRRLLMFLLEKLPKEKAQTGNESLGSSALLNKAVAAELARQLKLTWTPPLCKTNSTRWTDRNTWHLEGKNGVCPFHAVPLSTPVGTDDPMRKVSKATKRYEQRYLSFVSQQPPVKRDIVAALMHRNAEEFVAHQEWEWEWNRAGLASRLTEEEYRARKKAALQKRVAGQLRSSLGQGQGRGLMSTGVDFNQLVNSFAAEGLGGGRSTRFQKSEKLQFTSEDDAGAGKVAQTEEDLVKQREEEVASLQEQLAEATAQLEGMELDIRKFLANQQQLAELTAAQEAKNTEMEDEYRVKKRTFDLLPNAEENIVKLEALVGTSSDRLVKLGNKWEEHRRPLVEEYRSLREAQSSRMEATGGLLEEIKGLREQMKAMADEARMKDELCRRLVAECERMSKGQSRVSYTRRIMELVGNISKQKEGIAMILADTQQVQREINQLSGKLERIFIVTDEQIFKDAKTDQTPRTAYKHLAELRDTCGMALVAIQDIWQVRRQIKDLRDQIDNENSKKLGASLGKLSADLQEMKDENRRLVTKLKALKE